MYNITCSRRSVAQFGRALRSGRRGRGFESRHFDYLAGAPKALRNQGFRCFLCLKRGGGKLGVFGILRIFYELLQLSKKNQAISYHLLSNFKRL